MPENANGVMELRARPSSALQTKASKNVTISFIIGKSTPRVAYNEDIPMRPLKAPDSRVKIEGRALMI